MNNRPWYEVKIHFPADGTLPESYHEDSIRGHNAQDALKNAKWNWPAADKIELVTGEPAWE